MDTYEIIFSGISLLLIIIGLLGVFLPSLPGIFFSYFGLILFHFFGTSQIPLAYLIAFGILTFLSSILGYIIPLKTTKKYGGSSWGNWGGFIGTIVGFFVPIPLGFLFGMFLGVFIGEFLKENQTKTALRATKGAFFGFLYSTAFNFIVAFSILIIFLYYLIF